MGERVQWVDVARGLAIIAVVIYHASISLRDAGDAWAWGRIIQTLETFRMPLFFFASGLWSVKILQQPLGIVMRRRVTFFLYLYALWVFLRTAYGQVVHTPQRPRSWDEALLMFVEPHASLWFLYALALFALIVWACRKLPPALPLSVSLVASFLFSSGYFDELGTAWVKTGSYLFFFIAGVYLQQQTLSIARRIRLLPAVGVIALYAVCAVAWVTTPLPGLPGAQLVVSILGVAAGVALSVQLARLRLFDWLGHLGRNTLPIYLVHVFPLVAMAVGLIALDLTLPKLVVVSLVPVASLAAILISLGIYRASRRVPGLFDAPWHRTTSLKPAGNTLAP